MKASRNIVFQFTAISISASLLVSCVTPPSGSSGIPGGGEAGRLIGAVIGGNLPGGGSGRTITGGGGGGTITAMLPPEVRKYIQLTNTVISLANAITAKNPDVIARKSPSQQANEARDTADKLKKYREAEEDRLKAAKSSPEAKSKAAKDSNSIKRTRNAAVAQKEVFLKTEESLETDSKAKAKLAKANKDIEDELAKLNDIESDFGGLGNTSQSNPRGTGL